MGRVISDVMRGVELGGVEIGLYDRLPGGLTSFRLKKLWDREYSDIPTWYIPVYLLPSG